jgi:hypothetical protein
MLISILAGIAAAAMLFAFATDLGVWYIAFGVSVGFSVYHGLNRAPRL